MPCKFCLKTYGMKPCEIYAGGYTFFPLGKVGKAFINNCPCLDCLVKTMCYDKRIDCDSYYKFIARVRSGDIKSEMDQILKWKDV